MSYVKAFSFVYFPLSKGVIAFVARWNFVVWLLCAPFARLNPLVVLNK